MLRKMTAALASAAMVLTCMPATAIAEPGSAEISAQIEKAIEERDGLYEQAEAAAEEMNRVGVEISEASAELGDLEERIAETEEELSGMRRQLAGEIRTSYKKGTGAGALSMLLGSSSIGELLRGLYYDSKIQSAMDDKVRAVEDLAEDLRSKRDDAGERKEEQERLLEEQERRKEVLEEKIAEADAYVAGLDEDLREAIAEEEARAMAAAMAAATSYLSSAGADAGTVGTVDTIEYTVYDIEGVGAVDVSDYDALSRAIQIAYSDLPEWRQQVLAYAYASLGGEYVWGGEEFKACDCSGLTMLAYGSAGISLPHYSGSQSAFCNKSLSQAVPGDVCWKSGHVGIYIGNGATIEAMGPSYGITYGQLSSFTSCGNPVE